MTDIDKLRDDFNYEGDEAAALVIARELIDGLTEQRDELRREIEQNEGLPLMRRVDRAEAETAYLRDHLRMCREEAGRWQQRAMEAEAKMALYATADSEGAILLADVPGYIDYMKARVERLKCCGNCNHRDGDSHEGDVCFAGDGSVTTSGWSGAIDPSDPCHYEEPRWEERTR